VAVDSSARTWLFYVTVTNKLAYLLSPDAMGHGEFTPFPIQVHGNSISVNPANKQIAAVAWVSEWNNQEFAEVSFLHTMKLD
jgi:hypothetical protein